MGRVIEINHPAKREARGAITPPRLPLVDVARGAALVAMIVYHVLWDIDFFGIVAQDFAASPPMRLFSHAVATAFLFIAGVSVALAHRGKFNGKAFRSQFAKVALAAGGVTIVTRLVIPDDAITFGILHAIAVGLLIASPLAKAPFALTALLGAAAVAAPTWLRSAAFDAGAWSWLGLGLTEPDSLDWRPVLPWVGVMLLGLAAARSPAGQAFLVRSGMRAAPDDAVSRGLGWMGRRSLWIYLAHQPVLFGPLYLISLLMGATPDFAQSRLFANSCLSSCRASVSATVNCAEACACVEATLRASGQWDAALKGLDSADAAVNQATKVCLKR